MSTGLLQPTWLGYVDSLRDALVLFESCLNGTLSHLPRLLHDSERTHLIRSGRVFIYERSASGIRHWTDGVLWRPGETHGNFLVYKEIAEPSRLPEQELAKNKHKGTSNSGQPDPATIEESVASVSTSSALPDRTRIGQQSSEHPHVLISSLFERYGFKKDGLTKKTMTIVFQGVVHHLVSYYSADEVRHQDLGTPSIDLCLCNVEPRSDLVVLAA